MFTNVVVLSWQKKFYSCQECGFNLYDLMSNYVIFDTLLSDFFVEFLKAQSRICWQLMHFIRHIFEFILNETNYLIDGIIPFQVIFKAHCELFCTFYTILTHYKIENVKVIMWIYVDNLLYDTVARLLNHLRIFLNSRFAFQSNNNVIGKNLVLLPWTRILRKSLNKNYRYTYYLLFTNNNYLL